jgi:hypothetical protein
VTLYEAHNLPSPSVWSVVVGRARTLVRGACAAE